MNDERLIPKSLIHIHEEYTEHDWERTESGEIDDMAMSVGYHNGPFCKRCWYTFCVLCDPDGWNKEPCVIDEYRCPNCNHLLSKNDKFCNHCGDFARGRREVKIHYQCSNCGKRFQTSPIPGVPDGMYFSGCRAVGDAFYCEDCVKTWAERNGDEFDRQYKDPEGMFVRWWNMEVDTQCKGMKIETYRVVNGIYKEG